jgi:hypothetical protein
MTAFATSSRLSVRMSSRIRTKFSGATRYLSERLHTLSLSSSRTIKQVLFALAAAALLSDSSSDFLAHRMQMPPLCAIVCDSASPPQIAQVAFNSFPVDCTFLPQRRFGDAHVHAWPIGVIRYMTHSCGRNTQRPDFSNGDPNKRSARFQLLLGRVIPRRIYAHPAMTGQADLHPGKPHGASPRFFSLEKWRSTPGRFSMRLVWMRLLTPFVP